MPLPSFDTFSPQGSRDTQEIIVTGYEIFRVLRYFEKKYILVLILISSILAGIEPILWPYLLGDMVNQISKSSDFMESVKVITNKMILLIVFKVVVLTLCKGLRVFSNPYFLSSIRKQLFRTIINQKIPYFDKVQTGVLMSRIGEDCVIIRETYVEKSFNVIVAISQAITGIVFILGMSFTVFLLSMGFIIISIVVLNISNKFVDKAWVRFSSQTTNAAAKAEEAISQIRTVKAYNGQSEEISLYQGFLKGISDSQIHVSKVTGFKMLFASLCSEALTIFSIWYISFSIMVRRSEDFQPGDALFLMMSLSLITSGITQCFSISEDFRKANVSASKVLAILDTGVTFNENEGIICEQFDGLIVFDNVSFKYDNDNWVLRNFSFKINPGETVAFVGESGCGKTTCLSLIQRFYEVTEGNIYISGTNIKEMSSHYLRSKIAVVPQSPVLFSMSIRENIRFAKIESSEESIEEAAHKGYSDIFINNIKDKYDAIVQQSSLSGGQKQRLCISRAILIDAPILLLDEATASLDTQSEYYVKKSIDEVSNGKTTIIVAHRLCTIRSADRIFVFQNGVIVEEGNFEELLNQNGHFAELVQNQL